MLGCQNPIWWPHFWTSTDSIKSGIRFCLGFSSLIRMFIFKIQDGGSNMAAVLFEYLFFLNPFMFWVHRLTWIVSYVYFQSTFVELPFSIGKLKLPFLILSHFIYSSLFKIEKIYIKLKQFDVYCVFNILDIYLFFLSGSLLLKTYQFFYKNLLLRTFRQVLETFCFMSLWCFLFYFQQLCYEHVFTFVNKHSKYV